MVFSDDLHFVLIPLMTPGHTIPMLDLARLLADRGVAVTFVITPINLSRIHASVCRIKEADLPIHFLSIEFPCKEVGLPEGCENVDLLPSWDSLHIFHTAGRMLQEPLRLHLLQSARRPSCIISDFCLPWTRFVALDLGVPRFDFYSMSSFSLLCEHNLYCKNSGLAVEDGHDGDPFVVPGLPLRIEVTRAQVPGFFPKPDFAWMHNEVRAAESVSHGVVVNTFAELEPEFVDLLGRGLGKKIWTVGPVSLWNKHAGDQASRGAKSSIDVQKCIAWLDSMKPRSVIYVSFGTLTRPSLARLVEIGMGLEAAGRPFIWVVRTGEYRAQVEEWLAQGFEERTRDRALIVRDWAPQMTILSHPSVGGFLTHCGWNSCLEGITAGIPFLTWPGFTDQFLNERLLVDILRVAVPSGVKAPSFIGTDAGEDALNREDVRRAVDALMNGVVEGEERRRRVAELGKIARKAMDVGGSSCRSLTQLIEEVNRHVHGSTTKTV